MSLDVNISEPDDFNCAELHSCIDETAKILGISDFHYHVDILSGKGDNFVANIFRVVITENDNESNSVGVIVKTLINTARRELFFDFHKREVTVYKEVIPQFERLQREIDVDERIHLPECLYTSDSKNAEVIILKDLRDMGFGIGDIMTKVDYLELDQLKIILGELAKFHALSFVYEIREREKFNDVKNQFEDFLFKESFISKSKLRGYFFESYDMSLNVVNDVQAKAKLERLRSKLLEVLRTYSQPSKINVLCHGDLWINNILFKQGPAKAELCFLDFQVTRYCCPVVDIYHLMYLATTAKFRSDNFNELQNVYYDSLKSYLKFYNIDVNNAYPREDFEKDLEDNLPFGLMVALIELRIVTLSQQGDIDSEGAEATGMDLYESRVNDVVQESIDNGVLEKLSKLI